MLKLMTRNTLNQVSNDSTKRLNCGRILDMDKRLLVGGLLLLAFAIFCGVLANRDYHDSVGIFILIGFSVKYTGG